MFWRLKDVPSLKVLPGSDSMVLVGMGKSPAVNLADGPNKASSKRIVRKRHSALLATDPAGKRMFIIGRRGLPKKPKLTFAGWVPKTEYIPSKDLERSGTPKKYKHWVHSHEDDHGKWPKVYKDQNGNYHYGRGTYRVTDWIRK